MRVTCLIDSLGSGGAQRQLTLLATLLQKRGCDVRVITYYPYDFYLPLLAEAGVDYRYVQAARHRRLTAIYKALHESTPDVVLAFLAGANTMAEIATFPTKQWGLVVSERLAVQGDRLMKWRRRLHARADYVSTNSHTNRLILERSIPRLLGKVVTIYNAVDLDLFAPTDTGETCTRPGDPRNARVNFAVVATIHSQKNLNGVIEAARILRDQTPRLSFELNWYGRTSIKEGSRNVYHERAVARIDELGLQDLIRLHPPTAEIADVYRKADAVVLPSFFEGLPNVVCEAMSCARPVLASDVCDIGNLVKGGENGMLFDPTSPEDIARTMQRFASLPGPTREAMGRKGREIAVKFLDPEHYVENYLRILQAAAERKRSKIDHWWPEVPASAIKSACSDNLEV